MSLTVSQKNLTSFSNKIVNKQAVIRNSKIDKGNTTIISYRTQFSDGFKDRYKSIMEPHTNKITRRISQNIAIVLKVSKTLFYTFVYMSH